MALIVRLAGRCEAVEFEVTSAQSRSRDLCNLFPKLRSPAVNNFIHRRLITFPGPRQIAAVFVASNAVGQGKYPDLTKNVTYI